MNEYTNDVLDYYDEELQIITIDGKSNKEISDIIQDVSNLDKEFNDLFNWLNDNGEFSDAKLFHSLFNYGVDDSLSSEQINILKKYDFHVFSKIHLALELELKK